MSVDPELLPLRVAERAGRLLFWVMQQELTSAERDVAAWFITNADGEYLDTYKSHKAIAAVVNRGERSVRDALKGLRDKGLVLNEKRLDGNGRPTSDRNRLLAPPELAQLRTSTARPAFGAADEVDLSDFEVPDVRSDVPRKGPESTLDPALSPANPAALGTRMDTEHGRNCRSSAAEIADEPFTSRDVEDREIEEGSAADSAALPFELGRRGRRRAADRQLRPARSVFAVGEASA